MVGKNTKGIAMKRLVGALVALLAFTAAAQAQTYPTRPITMLVGFPPGGPTDTLARIVADAMQPSLGQSVVVETVSGASGTIASGRVVHASPDGYTIGIGNWTSHVGSPAIYPLDYDIFKGFAAGRAAGRLAAVDRRQERSAAEDGARADHLVEGETGPGDVRHHRLRQRRASVRPVLCAEDRRAASIRAVSRRRAGDAGFDRRPDRPVLP